MVARIHTYKLIVGAILGLLALGTLGGLLVLQFLSGQQVEEARVDVVVARDPRSPLFNGTVFVAEATALSALEEAGRRGGFDVGVRKAPGSDAYVERIGDYAASGAEGWLFCVGDPCRHPQLAADRYALRDGDFLRWHWGRPEDGLS